jgi:hypothetical protein
MFDLPGQGAAIVGVLEAISALGTVAYIDEDSQSLRYPSTFPAAYVVMQRLTVETSANKGVTSMVGWTVIVRSKRLNGPNEVLPMVELVVDALIGFKPADDMQPLRLLEIDYYGQQAESVAYAVRFGSRMSSSVGSC